jgi:Pvc16 N-terminal domain
MGNALSIAAVSRLLRQIVEGNITRYGLDGYVGADVVVTAEPPLEDPERVRLNLFLYRALESSAQRSQAMPTHDAVGRAIRRPTLALDLQYAVTAYAKNDFQSELMLGCAMQALNETPVLDRALIHSILSQDGGTNTLLDSRLAEQVDSIRIRHRNLSEDVFTRLWSAFHVPYRLTAFYEASVVLVEGDAPTRAPMLVLRRPEPEAHSTLGAFTPTLARAEPESAITGQSVILHGLGLGGANVQVEPDHRDPTIELPPVDIPAGDASESRVSFVVPVGWPIGAYELRVTAEPPGGGGRRPSTPLRFFVAPSMTVTSITRAASPPQQVTIELSVTPQILPGRPVALIVGSSSFAGPVITETTQELTFAELDLPAGPAATRLVVDGVESPWIDRLATPPAILPTAIVDVP